MNYPIILFWLIIAVMTLAAGCFLAFPLIKSKTQPIFSTALLLSTVLFAIPVYLKLGASTGVTEQLVAEQKAQDVKVALAKMGSNENIIKALLQRLQENPNSAQGWYLLGRMYLIGQHYENAFQAFAKANQLQPHHIDTMLSYAESSYFYHHQTLNPDAQALLNEILSIESDNIDAINLLAINAYQQAHYQQAIDYWEKLLEKFPSDSEDEKALLAMIHNAQGKLQTTEKSHPSPTRGKAPNLPPDGEGIGP